MDRQCEEGRNHQEESCRSNSAHGEESTARIEIGWIAVVEIGAIAQGHWARRVAGGYICLDPAGTEYSTKTYTLRKTAQAVIMETFEAAGLSKRLVWAREEGVELEIGGPV